jgi:hypothetical protein
MDFIAGAPLGAGCPRRHTPYPKFDVAFSDVGQSRGILVGALGTKHEGIDMAKKKRAGSKARTITKIVRAPAPIVRVSAPRAAPVRRRARRRSRGHSFASVGGGIISNETIQMAIGGAVYGFAVKSGLIAKLPAIPVVGRTGTAAILLDYWSRHGGGQMAHRAARAAAAIAGYQLGAEGKIQGDFAMGDATTPGALNGDYADGYDPLQAPGES